MINTRQTISKWTWRSGLIAALATFEIVLLAVIPYVKPLPDTTVLPFVNAQVAGNGGAENATVVYYKTKQVGAGPVVPANPPACPYGWIDGYASGPGYGPHYIAMIGYDLLYGGTGGTGGGWGKPGLPTIIIPTPKKCLSPETPIRMADGTEKQIKHVKVGDYVASFDEMAPERIVSARVEDVIHSFEEQRVKIIASGEEVSATLSHPFYVGDGQYRQVQNLRLGDTIYVLGRDNTLVPRVIEAFEDAGIGEVYNLSLGGPYNFFAGGFAGHNTQGPGGGRPSGGGGGGEPPCFTADTPVRMADGTTKRMDQVVVGDRVISFDEEGNLGVSTVTTVFFHPDARTTLTLTAGGRTVVTTPNHPFYVGGGRFVEAGTLAVGDKVYLLNQETSALEAVFVENLYSMQGKFEVFNLEVDDSHTYIAGDFAVHNKSGGGGACFTADTLVRMADGTVRRIDEVRPTDMIMAFDETGRLVPAPVTATYYHPSSEVKVTLIAGGRKIETTPTHPFYIGNNQFREVKDLRVGDAVYLFNDATGALEEVRIEELSSKTGSFDVFNLTVGGPHTFIAGGFAVHNKGGGGGPCFVAGTLISMADGSLKKIEEVGPGDSVVTFDGNGSLLSSLVTETFVHRNTQVTLTLTAGGRTVVTTPNHPFYVGGGRFVEAGTLAVGSTIYAEATYGHELIPVRVEQLVYGEKPTDVFNFEVAGTHTYIAEGFAVHNKSGFVPKIIGLPPAKNFALGPQAQIAASKQSAISKLLGVHTAKAEADPDLYSFIVQTIGIGSDYVCSLDQKTVVPINQYYQNTFTSAGATFYSDACSTTVDPNTNISTTECNRCRVCVRP